MKIDTIMRSKFVFINTGLVLAAGFFLIKTIQVWNGPAVLLPDPASIAAAGSQDENAKSMGHFSPNRAASKSSYRGITEKNLFSVDRKEYQPVIAETETVVTETVKVDGRKITLFGVMAIGDHPSALISNPDPKAQGRKTLWVTNGDRVGNLKVSAISDRAITFFDGKKKYRVDLYDQRRKRQKHTVTQKNEPVVVKTGVAKTKPPKKSTTAVGAAGTQTDGQYEIVNTPFGKSRRKKKKK
ncbi:MAG: hypothetical protein CSA23_02905 [Deltaproteobacteria bacterium]|nr:MAG: hypothetical protein CSA23_02905 [Deltaproteobacteria bacterium]